MSDLFRRRGFEEKDSKVSLSTHAAAADAVGRKRNCDVADDMDTSENLVRKGNCAADASTDAPDDSPATGESGCRQGEPHAAFAVDEEIAKGHAQW